MLTVNPVRIANNGYSPRYNKPNFKSNTTSNESEDTAEFRTGKKGAGLFQSIMGIFNPKESLEVNAAEIQKVIDTYGPGYIFTSTG